jgi:hypothetical protein
MTRSSQPPMAAFASAPRSPAWRCWSTSVSARSGPACWRPSTDRLQAGPGPRLAGRQSLQRLAAGDSVPAMVAAGAIVTCRVRTAAARCRSRRVPAGSRPHQPASPARSWSASRCRRAQGSSDAICA